MTTAPAQLLPDQLVNMLELVGQSDSVELKLTVPSGSYRAATRALALDPLEAQIRQVFFFDTPDLALNRAGVVVRARRIQGRDSDSTVKLRPLTPSDVDPAFRASQQFNIEVANDLLRKGDQLLIETGFLFRHLELSNGVIEVLLFPVGQRLFVDDAASGDALKMIHCEVPVSILRSRLIPHDLSSRLLLKL